MKKITIELNDYADDVELNSIQSDFTETPFTTGKYQSDCGRIITDKIYKHSTVKHDGKIYHLWSGDKMIREWYSNTGWITTLILHTF